MLQLSCLFDRALFLMLIVGRKLRNLIKNYVENRIRAVLVRGADGGMKRLLLSVRGEKFCPNTRRFAATDRGKLRDHRAHTLHLPV